MIVPREIWKIFRSIWLYETREFGVTRNIYGLQDHLHDGIPMEISRHLELASRPAYVMVYRQSEVSNID